MTERTRYILLHQRLQRAMARIRADNQPWIDDVYEVYYDGYTPQEHAHDLAVVTRANQ